MPRLNWDEVPDNDGMEPLPEGTYLAEITKIEESSTKRGDDKWVLHFTVIEPKPFAGRKFIDNMTFSPAALPRVKLVCHRLGIETKGEVTLTPAALLHRRAKIELQIEEREWEEVNDFGEKTGRLKRGKFNKVPFAGYEAVDNGIGKRIEEIANAPGSALAKATESEEAPF